MAAALVTGGTDILHTFGVVSLVIDHFELGRDLLETLLTLETAGVPVVADASVYFADYLLVAAMTGVLTLLFGTGGAIGLVILVDELAPLEGTLTAGTYEALGMVVVSSHLHHGVLDVLATGVALGQVGVGVALFAQELFSGLDVAVVERGLAGGTEEAGGVVVGGADGLVGAGGDFLGTGDAVHPNFIYY